MHNYRTKHDGLTLIELMIALLLGILLLLSITTMFITNSRVYREQESMSRLQENARFALETMIWDIRMAGYTGCADDISEVVNHVNGGDTATSIFNFSNAAEGSESKSNWYPSGSTDQIINDGIADIIPGTDAISVSYLDPLSISIAEPMPQVSAELKVTSVGNLVEGDIIAVSDCDSADIMEVTAVQTSSLHLQHNAGGGSPAPGNATQPLQKKYDSDAQIVSFVSRRYFIATGAYGGPSLFRTHNGTTPQELIEGVEQMQLLYGEDTDGDKIADTYVDAPNVGNWGNVISVRLSLLFRTVQQNFQIDPDSKTYTLLGGTGSGGVDVGPVNDYNRRRIFTTTIQIRNRST